MPTCPNCGKEILEISKLELVARKTATNGHAEKGTKKKAYQDRKRCGHIHHLTTRPVGGMPEYRSEPYRLRPDDNSNFFKENRRKR